MRSGFSCPTVTKNCLKMINEDIELNEMKRELTSLTISNARIEVQLDEIHRMLKRVSQYPTAIENIKVRIEGLEKCERENRRARFKIFSGLFFALVSGIGAIISNLVFR